MSRRVLLATGAVVVGSAGLVAAAQVTHRLDDVADALGIEPEPESHPADDRLLRSAAADMAALAALVQATADQHPTLDLSALVPLADQQLVALGGSTANTDLASLETDPAAALTVLIDSYEAAAAARAAQATRAVSPELVLVLASMSAGLAQGARIARRRA